MLSFGTELLLANYVNPVWRDTASLRIHSYLFVKEDTLKKIVDYEKTQDGIT